MIVRFQTLSTESRDRIKQKSNFSKKYVISVDDFPIGIFQNF